MPKIGIGIGINTTQLGHTTWDELAPSGLALTVLSASSIRLNWIVNSHNPDGTKVERSTDGVSFTEVGSVAGATFMDTGLTNGIRYYYRVRNYKDGSNSAYTTIANTYTWLIATLTATDDGTGVSTLRMEVSETQTFTLDGAARFYTDAAGTTGESTTWEVTAGELRTIYLKCPTGTANLTIPKPDKVIKWGNSAPTDGWTSPTNAAEITIEVGKLALTELRISGTSTPIGALPTNLTYLYLYGNSINWKYTGALPTGLTYLHLQGNSINWKYTGALPTNLTHLYLQGNLINWIYSGALLTGLTYLCLYGNLINWIYSGALPTGLIYLYLDGSSIAWTYSGALPTGLINLVLAGSSIDWTGLDVGNNGNITLSLNLANYRISKMTSTDMVTLLTQLTNRTGLLPKTITINDYADYASPPTTVTDAVAALKLAKSITTINLGA